MNLVVRVLSRLSLQSIFASLLLTSSPLALALTPADLPSWLSVDRSFELLNSLSLSGQSANVVEFELSMFDPNNKLGYMYFGQLNTDQTVTWLNGTPGTASGTVVELKEQVVTIKDKSYPLQFSINPAQEVRAQDGAPLSEVKVLFKKPQLKISSTTAPSSIKTPNKSLFPLIVKFSGEFFLPGSKITAPALMLEIDETATFEKDGLIAKAGTVSEQGQFVTSKGTAKWSPDKNGNLMITRMWGESTEVIVLDLKSRRSYVQGNKREISAFEAYTTTKGNVLYTRPGARSASCETTF